MNCTATARLQMMGKSDSAARAKKPEMPLLTSSQTLGPTAAGPRSVSSLSVPSPHPRPCAHPKAFLHRWRPQSWLAGLAPLAQLILAAVTMPLDRCSHASGCKLVPPPSKPASRLQLLLCLQCPCEGLSLSAGVPSPQDLLPGDQRS